MKLYISIPITGRPLREAKHQVVVIKVKPEPHLHPQIHDFMAENGGENG